MSKKNIATFKSSKNSNWNDNTTGDISAGDSRNVGEDVGDSFYNRMDGPELATADVSGGTITLDLNNDRIKSFVGSASFGTDKTIAFSNLRPHAVIPMFRFTLSAACSLSFPVASKVLQNSGTVQQISDATIWTPFDAGDFEASLTWDNSDWFIQIRGPFE